MICTACRPIAMALASAAILAAVAVAPVYAWAAGDDDPGEAPAPMVMGDFNRDGIADMAKVILPDGGHSEAGSLSVMLGQGDGGFKQVGFNPQLGHDPRSIVVGDFNKDGILDVIVGDGDGSLMELLGDGTGKLVPAGNVGRVGSVVSMAVGDFNHDGILDVAVSDSSANLVTVLVGAGGGSFQPIWAFSLPRPGTVVHIAVADFNGDGVPDLVVTNADEDTFEVLLGNGNGTFTDAPDLSKSKDPNSHCAA